MSSLSEEEKQIFHKLLFKIDFKERKELIQAAILKHDLEISQKFVDDFFYNVNMIKLSSDLSAYRPYSFHLISDFYGIKENVFLMILTKDVKVVDVSDAFVLLKCKFTVVDTSTLKQYTIKNEISLSKNLSDQKSFNKLLYKRFKEVSVHFIRPKGRKKTSL